jgi:hypothetical protein
LGWSPFSVLGLPEQWQNIARTRGVGGEMDVQAQPLKSVTADFEN